MNDRPRMNACSFLAGFIPGRIMPLVAIATLTVSISAQTLILVPSGAVWKYRDTGVNAGTSWRTTNYNDVGWASGPAELGYGDSYEATTNRYGSDSGNKYITTYYRLAFVVTNRPSVTNLAVRLVRDDGGVVYLNGTEVFRSNLPEGSVYYDTYASRALGGEEEHTYVSGAIPPGLLQSGSNWLAVEIHQSDPGSSDLSFNLELLANSAYGNLPPAVSLSSPIPGIFQSNQVFTLAASASDPDSFIDMLEFYQDGGLIRTCYASGRSSFSWSFSWSNAVQGIHTYYVRAIDSRGVASTSAPVRILLPRAETHTTFYPSFSTSGLTLQGSASVLSNYLRLTPNRRAQLAAAWLPSRQPVKDGFETIFQFRVTDLFNGGADGIAFLIEGTSIPMLGSGDNSMGFGGITNCLAVSFDTWVNGSDSINNDNHISIQSLGLAPNTGDAAGVLAYNASLPVNMSDGAVHTVKIEYHQQLLRVFLDNMSTPVLTYSVDLARLLYLPTGTAWVGFTAATGWMAESQDIMAWAFASMTNQPPTVTLVSPTNITRCLPGTNLVLLASATAPMGVAQVEFLDGTNLVGIVTNAPYSLTWSNVPLGYHNLTAKVTDRQGGIVTSLPVLLLAVPSGAGILSYPNFNLSTGLTFQGVAALSSNRVRLTPPADTTVGAVWLDQKQMLQHGFECALQFQIAQFGGGGADGMAFVIQNNASPLLGITGQSLGYDQVANSLAVEFDTHVNTEETPMAAPHIAIQSRGQAPNSCNSAGLLAYAYTSKLLDGGIHTALIRYQPGHLRVFLDNLDTPLVETAVRLDTWMNLDNGSAWLGFTAATGGAWESHDLIAWAFRANIPPNVAFAEPLDYNLYSAPGEIRLRPFLQDPDGAIARVDYFLQDVALASSQTPPFDYQWNDVPVGDYVLTARATDDFGAVSTMAAAHVSVLNRPLVEAQVSRASRTVRLEFRTLAGRTYRVQYSSDLVNWHDTLLPIPGTDGYLQWQDSGPPISESLPFDAPQRFYRVVIVP